MPRREIIRIDEGLCDGCGLCVTACAEGAIEVVDGKARLVSETYCDGLGACLGECPRGAISLEAGEVPAFDEAAAAAHFERRQVRATAPRSLPALKGVGGHACPSTRSRDLGTPRGMGGGGASSLRQWPVQLHLISPASPVFDGSHLLVAADCAAFAAGDFHPRFMAGRTVAIACPKLDSGLDAYEEKLVALASVVASVTVAVMEVPCCSGLVRLVQRALARSGRDIPLDCIVLGVGGDVLHEARIAG